MFLLNTKLSITLLTKRPLVTLIKTLGLTLGVAIVILLMAYADQEFSFDRHFKNSDRIYRTLTIWTEGNGENVNPICLREIYETVLDEVPEVESVVQIYRGGAPDILVNENRIRAKRMLYADPEFERVFTPNLIAGDIKKALSSPGMLLITDRLADILFPDNEALGKSVVINEKVYSIEAIIQEYPYQSHFRFDMLAAMEDVEYLDHLGGLEFFTYTLFKEDVNHQVAIQKHNATYQRQLDRRFEGRNMDLSVTMEALPRIHLFTKASYDLSPNGDVTIIVSLALLAILILALAITNYVNLYLVHSENRSLEIGIRRSAGSGRRRLVLLFFAESLGITLLAFSLGLILLHSSTEWIRTNFSLGLNPDIWSDPGFYLKLLGLMLLTSVLAGLYPALYLSKLNPVKAIYSSTQGGSRKTRLTRLAVIFQFSVSVFLLIGIGFLYKQMNYVSQLPLGFSPGNVISINNLSSKLVNNQESIRLEFSTLPHVLSAGASQGTPATGKSGQLIYEFGKDPEEGISIAEERVQPGYFETFGIQLLEGRVFKDGSVYDQNCVILNEKAVKDLGIDDPIGTKVHLFTEPMEVIGVVKDFHFASLKHAIGPLVFTNYSPQIFNFQIKAEDGYTDRVVEGAKEILHKFDPDQVVNVGHLDQQLRNKYYQEYQLARILVAGAVLAIFLSVMGLFGLSLFSIQDRTKEIGVRKVLGANVGSLARVLTWDQLKWILIAIPIGSIPAYWLMSQWLNNFVFKTTLSWWMFIPAALIALFIAIVTVSFQVIRVANRNPVESLRYE